MNSLFELGIGKYGHRLEIKSAIESLFPNLLREVGNEEKMMIDDNRSSMYVSG